MSKQFKAPFRDVEKKNQPASHLRAASPSISEEVSILLPRKARHPSKVLGPFEQWPIYPEGKSHRSRLTFDSDGKVIRRPELASYAQMDQRMAIHEAAHAVVAWALGGEAVGISYQESLVICGLIRDPFGCSRRGRFFAGDSLDVLIAECAAQYAGCVAEARHAHVSLPYCMRSSGLKDAERIGNTLKEGECILGEAEQQQALFAARRITGKYQDLIAGVAEILLNKRWLAANDFMEIVEKLGYPPDGDEAERGLIGLARKFIIWDRDAACSSCFP